VLVLALSACTADSRYDDVEHEAAGGDNVSWGDFEPSDGDAVDLLDPTAPFFERGLVLPESALACVPAGSTTPQLSCNHHGSSVAELHDGTIAIVWYHGVEEKSLDSRIVWSKRAPGAAGFAPVEVLYDDPARAEGNPVLWVDEDGELFVFFVTIMGEGWHQSAIRLVRSSTQGALWSAPTFLREDYCWMTRNHPLRLANGEMLLPLYNECLAMPVFMRGASTLGSWQEEQELSMVISHAGQIQPAVVQLGDGTVAAITRDGTPINRIRRFTSSDSGASWTAAMPIDLPNKGTGVDQVRLANGHVVVIFNNSVTQRFPLAAALSTDGGATFGAIRHLNEVCDFAECQYSYPSIIQAEDESIWVSYTYNRTTIGYVRFNELWLAAGTETARLE
jgi:predicted neuraminidase